MYSFSDLYPASPNLEYPFCYLLGVLRKMPPNDMLDAAVFTDAFGWIYSGEDQCQTCWQLRRRSKLTRKYVLPTAPLTIAPHWSPFPLAFDVLSTPLQHGRSDTRESSAFAIFAPEFNITSVSELKVGDRGFRAIENRVEDKDIFFENIHAHHFFWLLKMTVARAKEMKRLVFLAGMPGFGYSDLLENDSAADSKLLKLKSGYLYPDRVPQGARYSYLCDLTERRLYAERQASKAQFANTLPPLP